MSATDNITIIRRRNVLHQFQLFAAKQTQAGEAPSGLGGEFAKQLQVSLSFWSQLKNQRPISDAVAQQIERHLGLEDGWMSMAHDVQVPDEREDAFIALARTRWQSANAKQKRELLRLLELPKA